MSMVSRFLTIFSLAALCSLSGCAEPNESGLISDSGQFLEEQDTYAILGGQAVKFKDRIGKSTVMLLNLETNELCTGTLISPYAILTAGHCIPKNKESLQVYFSLNPLAPNGQIEAREVSEILIHPKYNPAKLLESVDLALLQLPQVAPAYYRSVSLPQENSELEQGKNLILAGYGNSSAQKSVGYGRLRRVTVQVSAVTGAFFEVDQSIGKGICDGDSGGPAYELVGKKLTLVGVSKLVYDKAQTGAENCRTYSQFTSLIQNDIQEWIHNFVQKSLADSGK